LSSNPKKSQWAGGRWLLPAVLGIGLLTMLLSFIFKMIEDRKPVPAEGEAPAQGQIEPE
jgi:hypothetical protein